MSKVRSRTEVRKTRHRRVRKKVSGTAARPRLVVFRSNQHIYAQAIDDLQGHTVASASSVGMKLEAGGNKEAAQQVGSAVAKKLMELSINQVVFDRGGYLYHGRVQAVAEGAREQGLVF